jgi:hypothetical protein
LQRGDSATASQLLLDGLAQRPGDEQLNYLARIMAREGSLKAAGQPSAKSGQAATRSGGTQ